MSLKSPSRLLTSLSIAAVLLAGGFFVQEAISDYDHELSVLQRTLESEATLLAEHAQLTLSTADRLLQGIVWEAWENDRESMQASLADRSFYQYVLNTPQLAGLIVTDAEGVPLFTAKRLPMPLGVLTNQDFFQAHREGAYQVLGRPVALGADTRRLIPVSQRLDNAQGTFAGVAVVLLDTDYLRNFYTEVSQKLQFRIGLFRHDGAALALYPAPVEKLSSTPAELEAMLFHQHAQTLFHDSPLDGTRRVTTYRNLDVSPAAITVSYSYDAFMAGLIPGFLRSGLTFLLFAAGVGISVLLIKRGMREAFRAREAQLGFQRQHQETLQLCHAIARNLPNGRVFVVDDTLRYVFVEGEAWQDNAEFQLQELIGKTIREAYPDDVSRTLEALARNALTGTEANSEVSLHGRTYKAFATPLPDDDGTIRRCLLLSQEITQFKEDQQALETRNRKLHRLASHDGLLGIANRREFERVLEREWKRGLREAQPLSLLLIDVDHFKQYNDSYGHPAGDACLQEIATLLREALGRPADLAARYGGEEMAVLLPNTDRTGALHIAERIHALLAECTIPFEASPVAPHVTVSIGLVSRSPDTTGNAGKLVEEADEALYAAKGNGRNRTEDYGALASVEDTN